MPNAFRRLRRRRRHGGGVLPRRGLRPAGRRQRGAQRPARRDAAWRRSAGRPIGAPSSPSWSGRRRATSPTPTGAGRAAPSWRSEILLDADLAVLGAEPAAYAAYVNGVRGEYAHLSAARVGERAVAVVEALLARSSLYATAPARSWWEERARANLPAELASLAALTRGSAALTTPTVRLTRTGIGTGAGRAAAITAAAAAAAAARAAMIAPSTCDHANPAPPLHACRLRASVLAVAWLTEGVAQPQLVTAPVETPTRRRHDAGHRRAQARPHRQGRARRVGRRQGARSADLRDPGRGPVRVRLGAVA